MLAAYSLYMFTRLILSAGLQGSRPVGKLFQ